ncbi:nuclear transport factor 2 family protein [Antrihabitans sp. YC2-6]|uniref:nuclear transport factor 2 family protein n=1 Tax=Antrihabitans sp. YC2-6 TaxID=2799498 RepID=UPI0018F62D2A|nr:nuclear transport factor 2 family protein [Antrihabitans sp. YC2-6]MBJ8345519.1 nuclear transport factor 2 family protein [Antrihabitans sp. YC2-6]
MRAFREAIERGDFASLPALFTDDVVFRSPIAHKPYHGRETLGAILMAVSKVFEDLTYERVIGNEGPGDHALVFNARVGDLAISGCDFLHVREDGLIDEFTVMLRPLKAVNAFAEKMAVQFAAAMEEMAAAHAAQQATTTI